MADTEKIAEIFPDYGETVILKEGKPSFLCKIMHRRILHHAFYTKATHRGKEYYECHICLRCDLVEGRLVNIVAPKKTKT